MTDTVKFLVVDDTPENLVAMEALLRREGLELLIASSGPEALELLLQHEVALALLDVQMPGMDGFELAELMRGTERTRHVPIIFVTAGARDPSRTFKGYEAGAVDFLYKPIDPHILASKASVFFDLACQRTRLASVLRLNEMFIAILGHDLRNPLATLTSGAQLLEMRHADDATRKITGKMLAAGGRMTEMIEQLLDLTRSRLGDGLVNAREEVDIASVVERTIEELRVAHPARRFEVTARPACTAIGDSARLLQLFSNLIANAVQHGDPAAPIRIAVESGEAEVVVRIHNLGIIDPALVPGIFDPFRRRSESVRGLGLGTYIAREVARGHGGDVEVISGPEVGTTFTVRLPRRWAGRSLRPAAAG
jgi:two-component system sensor histidine kinase/response regulator